MLPYFHPTSVVLVDDDPSFLESFRFHFSDHFNCLSFQRPADGLDYLLAQGPAAFAAPECLRPAHGGFDQIDHRPGDVVLQLNAARLTEIFSLPARFRLPTVAVVDYAMPGMNGVQFLDSIRNLPIKRLMLTGRADERTAIDAFNAGVIDGFFMKHEPDLELRLLGKIKHMQSLFFTERTAALHSALGLGLPFLTDPALDAPFNALLESEKLVEYCVQSEPPGVLGVKADGRQVLYIMVEDDYIRASIEIAMAEDAPAELVTRMEQGQELAMFPTSQGFYRASFASTWRRFLVPATRIDGQRAWRTALLDQPSRLGFGLATVATYDAFLDDPLSSNLSTQQ